MNTTTPDEILRLKVGTKVTTGEGIPLVVNYRQNVVGLTTVPDAARYGGTRITNPGVAEAVTLTQDGRGYNRDGWHQGDDGEDAVYVERWTASGREFHGWIDSRSRKLVQAG